MPTVQIDDTRLYYHTDGNPDRPCVVLSNSLTERGRSDALLRKHRSLSR